MTDLIPTARGYVNTWQCDENDHLNVQFFTALADDASAFLGHALGLGPAALRAAGLTIRPVEDHIRYHRDLRAEDTVQVVSGAVEIADGALSTYHELRNLYSGGIAATVRRRSRLEDADGRAIEWPAALAAAVAARRVVVPEIARARSTGRIADAPKLTLDMAEAAGLIEICADVVKPEECDAAERMRPRFHFARYSDGAPSLWHALGFDRVAMRERRMGSIVLELRQLYVAPPRSGTPLSLRTGIVGIGDKTLDVLHCLFDAESGALVGWAEGAAALFDQAARKLAPLPASERTRLTARLARLP
ncbi:MAG: thioesterase family protein [Rhodospirillales bacterium]|nr:MAG: thioesterase family protein [Rhodospirillales bacterium]